VAGGAYAPRTLLVPSGVELLSDLCPTVNPAFGSGIFFMARHVFLFRAAEVGGPEVPVISTSDSLPTEESEENSLSSSAGMAISLLGSPSGRGAGDQYTKTLAYRKSELYHNPTGAVGKHKEKIEKTTQK